MTDYFSGVDQNIPDWLFKITFLVKVKTAFKSDIKSRFGIMSFSTSDTIFGPVIFLFNNLMPTSPDKMWEASSFVPGTWQAFKRV